MKKILASKKKIFTILVLATMVAATFVGCGKAKVKQVKESVTFEAGSDFKFKVADFFEYSNNKKIKKNDYKLDASKVDTSKVGEYDAKITFGKGKSAQKFTIKVVVEDTVAPKVALVESDKNYAFMNTVESKDDFASVIKVEDATKTQVTATYEKLGDVEVASDEAIQKYLDMVESKKGEDIPAVETTEGTETPAMTDGYYRMVLTAKDEGENESSVEFLAIYDATMPVVSYDGVEVADGGVIASADASKVSIHDALSGDFTADDFEFAYDETAKTVKITVGDKAGNLLVLNLTVDESIQVAGGSTGSGTSSGGGSGSGNTSGKPSIMIEYPGLSYGNEYQMYADDPIYAGFVTTSNGYTFYVEEIEKFIRMRINAFEHIYQVYVTSNDTWACLADSEAQVNQIMTAYVQSLYGSSFTAKPYQVGGYDLNKTMGFYIDVYKDGVWIGELDTDNIIYGFNNEVLYTP